MNYEYIIDPAWKGEDGAEFLRVGFGPFWIFSSLRAFIDADKRFDGNVFVAPGTYVEPLEGEAE